MAECNFHTEELYVEMKLDHLRKTGFCKSISKFWNMILEELYIFLLCFKKKIMNLFNI